MFYVVVFYVVVTHIVHRPQPKCKLETSSDWVNNVSSYFLPTDADINKRDYSGRKPRNYLPVSASSYIKRKASLPTDIIGLEDDVFSYSPSHPLRRGGGGRAGREGVLADVWPILFPQIQWWCSGPQEGLIATHAG